MRVPIAQVGPTQDEIGQAAVNSMKHYWLAQKRPAHVTLRSWLNGTIKAKFANKVFEGIRDPKGVVRILDGHHRARMLSDLARQYHVPYEIQVTIVKDYTGWTHDRYALDLVNNLGKGQFAHRPEHASKRAIAKMVASLPKTVTKCKDSPMRSITGTVFFKAGIDSDLFADYIEFKLGAKLFGPRERKARHRFLAKINNGTPSAKNRVLREMKKSLLGPEMLAYLAKNMRHGSEKKASAVLRQIKGTSFFRKARAVARVRKPRVWRKAPRVWRRPRVRTSR
ncbi:MAG: hypothetical protein KAI47_09000 [Deltaproteobacteria bacterium]|nr:hypothetical protein [Deltaproteobacteria bacterium]